MKYELDQDKELSTQISSAIRDNIINGQLIVNQRLPSESELCDQFDVSRSTVREALKRLAAQNLIRTQRGATGGAFVNKLSFKDAYRQQITTSTLLLSMNTVSFETACEARFALERACIPLAVKRRTPDHLASMRAEIHRQAQPGLTDESFCASDVAFHRTLVDSAQNPIMSYQLAGAVEAIEPLMNMITFTARKRERIVAYHTKIADTIEAKDVLATETALAELAAHTLDLANEVAGQRKSRKS